MRNALLAVVGTISFIGCSTEEQSVEQSDTVRFATFNVYLNRPTEGAVRADLATKENIQAQKVAEIIQRTAPDILLLNEFDYDAASEGLTNFQKNYLEISQNGATPAIYPYVFVAPSNTGEHSGFDLNRDGVISSEPGSREYGGDAFGYGEFPGQFAMAILSKYPITEESLRTFQTFLWKDMPGALLPDDPETPEPQDWYGTDILAAFRLSSKSHWDVPVNIDDKIVHVLASHPTPPGFDGDEDRNGKRNFDENRFWVDYIKGDPDNYIYDDAGVFGGLSAGDRFVIMGDLNADPHDGGAVEGAISQLISAEQVADAAAPKSEGGNAQAQIQAGANLSHVGAASEDTADFNDDPEVGIGNLRLDYVLHSKAGLEEVSSGIFWPTENDAHYELIGPGFPVESSDHRLVWRDLVITD